MKKFMLAELTSDTSANFYCPYCEKLVLSGTVSDSKPLPDVCPHCNKEIDNTGITPIQK